MLEAPSKEVPVPFRFEMPVVGFIRNLSPLEWRNGTTNGGGRVGCPLTEGCNDGEEADLWA